MRLPFCCACGVGSIPHGYRLEGEHLVPDEREQEYVAIAKRLRAEGFTYRAIRDVLNQRGYRNRAGKPFGAGSLVPVILREAA